MKRCRETTRFLCEVGYPDALFLQWGISLNENNRSKAELEWDKIRSRLPNLERRILDLRYHKFFTLRQISKELGMSVHVVRKRKEEILRKIMHSKEGIKLYQAYRQENDVNSSFDE